MDNYKNWLLYSLCLFCIFILSSCEEVEVSIYTKETIDFYSDEVENSDNYENGDNIWGQGLDFSKMSFINVFNVYKENINLDDILNNPIFTEQENREIQNAIVNIILYINGFEVDYDDILSVIDKAVSGEYYAEQFVQNFRAQYQEDGWTIADEINTLKDRGIEDSLWSLYSFAADFMMRVSFNEDGLLDVMVPFFNINISNGQTSGYLLYYFLLEKVEGVYKVIGLWVGA